MGKDKEFDWSWMIRKRAECLAAQPKIYDMKDVIGEAMARMKYETEHAAEILAEAAPFENMPYREYLRTDYWRAKRLAILRRDRFRCRDCGSKKRLNVHHKTYGALRGRESDGDLITVCRRCHLERHRETIPGARRQRSR